MTPRERFLTALNLREPDRVPVFATLTPQVAETLGKLFGLPWNAEDSFLSTRNSHTEILLQLGNDAVCIAACRDALHPTIRLENGNLLDEWGIEYKEVGLYTEAVKRPLAGIRTIKDLNRYTLPDPAARGRWVFCGAHLRDIWGRVCRYRRYRGFDFRTCLEFGGNGAIHYGFGAGERVCSGIA